jgi:hypothetical protein
MAIVTAPGRFCYLECDEPACGRKIYQYHERVVQELALLSGWKNRGASWICPACAEKSGRTRVRPSWQAAHQEVADSGPRGERRPSSRSTVRRRQVQAPRWR